MNLVRGVAGLLRRSSTSSIGESLPEEQGQLLLDNDFWPEIEFNRDNEEEQVLWSLWDHLSQKSGATAEAEQALRDFLKYFLKVYENWAPEELVLGSDQSSVKEKCVIMGCRSGHPSGVIISLTYELKTVTRSINKLSDLIDQELDHFDFDGRIDLLHVLAILTRASLNRHIFRVSEGLQSLVNLMKATVVQLKCTVGAFTNMDAGMSPTGNLLIFLQDLLIHVITVVSHFMQSEISGASNNISVENDRVLHSTAETVDEHLAVPRKTSFGIGGTIPLLETGGLNWFVELLRIKRTMRLSGIPFNRCLEQLALTTLRAAFLGNLRAQNHFRSLGGIDVLIEALGSTLTTDQFGSNLRVWWSPEDFQTQVLSLEVLREAVFRNLNCLKYLCEKDGAHKFVEVIVWAAFIGPKQINQESKVDGDIVQGWNLDVSQLCKILCSFLVASGDIRGFVMGLSSSHDASGTVGSYSDLAIRWIVKVLTGTFLDMKSLQVPRSCSTTLQHYTLYVFKKMLASSHAVLSIFHEEGLWEVMFSEHFFYFEMEVFSIERSQETVQDEATPGLLNFTQSYESMDSEPLRLEVISFVELAATATGSFDNGPECYALMKALEHCAGIPSVATMIVKSLHRILQLAPDQTVCAFKNLEALLLLSQVMDIQLQEYMKFSHLNGIQSSVQDVLEDAGGSKVFTLRESWKLSREVVFDLFAEYVLTSEEARIVSLHSTKTMQVLFDLLWDSESRKFALKHILDVMKLPPTSKEDQGAKLELCVRYLETLSQSSHEGKPKDMDVVMDLLAGIREVLETDHMYYQALFQEAECFVHIVSLLNENLSEQQGKLLCLSVIETLKHLLSENATSKNAFRSLVGTGYSTLQTLLLNSHQGSPTEELLSALLDLLVDGNFSIPGKMTIQNEDIIILFFSILRRSCETLQLFGLLTFSRVLEESTANKVACVNAGLLSSLLDWFDSEAGNNLITKLAVLIEALGRHSVTGKDMRKIFSLLRNANQAAKPAHRKILLNIVQGMLKEGGPAVFFEMSGKDSGILITTPLRWPSVKGSTFSCWMRVEAFPVTEKAKENYMGLFSFLTESGKGYNAMIAHERMVVEILGQKRQTALLNTKVPTKCWFHLCITHSVGRALSSGGSVRVYIDGCLAASDKLRYPKIYEPMNKCTIGTLSSVSVSEGVTDDMKLFFPFCGQLGPVYLFDDALTHDQIIAVFQAGPSYMYSFLSTEIACIAETLASNIIFDLKEGLSSKMVFGFNAQASSEGTVFDVASNSDGTTEKVPYEALLMGGTRCCHRHLLKDIIDCVGGVGVFFPLLTQLDQPQFQRSFPAAQEGMDSTLSVSTSNVYVAAEVIELITLVLDSSPSHQQYIHQNKGMSIIGFLLQLVSPQHLTTGVASALVHLLSVVSKSNGVSRKLLEETLLNIFLNLYIWIYTPYMVQRELLITLLNYCETEAGIAQDHISLPKVLDLVQQFYWDKPKNRKIAGTKRIFHPVTKEVIGERPGREEVGKLRILLLSLAEIAARDSISMSDTKALLAYLVKIDDPVCLEDILHMLLRLLGRKEFATSFLENIQNLGGCQVFLVLLERQEEPLRLLGLQIIGLVLTSVPNEKKGSWLLSIAAGVTRPAYDHQRAERLKITPLFTAVTERLIVFPFTDMLCATLFDVLLGGASLKQVLQRGPATIQDSGGQKDTFGSSQFALPQVLGILMKFALICANQETRAGVTRDILRLLEANPSSSDVIVLEPSWQCWFFDLLMKVQENRLQVENKDNTHMVSQEEELAVYGIFTIIHGFCIYKVRGGWRHLERTFNFVHIYAEKGLLSKNHVLRHIFGDVVEALLQTRSQETVQMSQPCRDNTLYVMNLLDELLIREVIQVLPFPKDEFMENVNERVGLLALDIMTEKQGSTSESLPHMEMRAQQDEMSGIKEEDWQFYNKSWDILKDIYGAGKGDPISGPSLGQRARGLVESINIPAAEMAAAVVAGGLGAVVNMNPTKLIDKAMKLRGEKFPRVVFHLVVLYIYKGSLEAASFCVHQFLSLLPLFLSTESEQCKNRLQLFLWCSQEARTQVGLRDNGARFHLISQLIRETMEQGKNMLAASIANKEDNTNDVASLQSVLQQDRIINAVKEEKLFINSLIAERSNEVDLLKFEMEEAEGLGKSNSTFLEEQLQSTLISLRASDHSRIVAAQLLFEEDQQAVSDQWCHMFRHLTDERGPWSTISFPGEIQISWKLDRTEDPWRRRLKLKRNYNFDNQLVHTEERCETMTTSSFASEKISSFETFLETSKLLLKGLRGISEEEDPDLLEERAVLGEDENDSELQQLEQKASPEPLNIEEVESNSGPVEQAIRKGEETFMEEVLYSSVCVLVTPKRKLAGRLDITRHCLHFYGDFLVEGTGGSSTFTSSGQINCADHIALDSFEKGMIKGHTELRDGTNLESQKNANQDKIDRASYRGLKCIKRHRRWDVLKVRAVHGTRYLLQYTALEIFFENSIPPVFLNFFSQKIAKEAGQKIVSLRNDSLSEKAGSKEKPENKYFVDKRLAIELAEHYRDRWRRREINNFEYLMQLNTLAGRSYNDLTQYPVFPWIISDYTSEVLDLSSASSFRDLSKPIGALDEKRFEVFKERYQNFSDPDIPSFYYGSHYSSMGIVLFYLLRLEPFTSLHRNLQGGKFDHADRLFHSIEGTFKNCMANTSDVKELIPEFFYMPEFFVNSNKYHMGIKQDGERLDNVELPPWAKGSCEEFILKNREALESEFVSQHLHQWIDLIFGYQQRGCPAVEAANVFYHLTYEGAVELESLEDRLQRAAVEDQIANFGQTPMQLFRKKHPRRGPAMPISRPLYYAPASITLTSSVAANLLTPSSASEKQKGLVFVGVMDNKVVLVTSELKILLRNWLTAQSGGNFTFSASQDPFFAIGAEVSQPYKIKGPFAKSIELSSWCFRTVQIRASNYLLTCGFWDNSFRITSLSDGTLVQSNRQHKDVVSCLAVSSDGSILVTGSHDTTVMVWDVVLSHQASRKPGAKDASSSNDRLGKRESIMFDKPLHVLSGHDDVVTCVAVSVELDLVVSGSKDCSCILHTLRQGTYVQSIQHPFRSPISRLVVSKHGLVVLFSKDDLMFLLYSVNGKHLASSETNGRINCIELSNCGEFLVCGGDQGQIVVRSIYTLEVVRRYDGTNTPILSLVVTSEDCFLAGLQDGSLLIFSIERPQQRRQNLLQSLRTRST